MTTRAVSIRRPATAAIAAVAAALTPVPASAQAVTPQEEPLAVPGNDEMATTGGTSDTDASEPEGEATTASGGSDEQTMTTASRRRRLDRVLREGMRGSDVRHLQKVLTELNFRTRVDGIFGTKTKRSVRRYEHWKEDVVNGVVHRPQADRMQRLMRKGVRYRNHKFPVRGPHDYGGAGARFGAPRGDHAHMGQDIAAAGGTRLVAAHEGRVEVREYQAGGAGHYLVIHGRDDSDSVYMHLRKRVKVAPGEKVMAGERIGRVGTTGSSTGPHLHFELWTRHWYDGGEPYDPLKKLKRWDRRT